MRSLSGTVLSHFDALPLDRVATRENALLERLLRLYVALHSRQPILKGRFPHLPHQELPARLLTRVKNFFEVFTKC
nr:hypothetical protein DOP62_11245 [Synechococcus elongatus PCC 11801]